MKYGCDCVGVIADEGPSEHDVLEVDALGVITLRGEYAERTKKYDTMFRFSL